MKIVQPSGSELQIDTISHLNLKPLNQISKGDIPVHEKNCTSIILFFISFFTDHEPMAESFCLSNMLKMFSGYQNYDDILCYSTLNTSLYLKVNLNDKIIKLKRTKMVCDVVLIAFEWNFNESLIGSLDGYS